MERHELFKLMSKPMMRSFQTAEEEALREVRQENGKLYDEMMKATREWDKENAEKWETIAFRYQIQMELIKKQRDALYQLEQATREEMKEDQNKIYAQQYQALAPIREAQKEKAEANSKKWKEITAEVIAKYEARLQAKKELVNN